MVVSTGDKERNVRGIVFCRGTRTKVLWWWNAGWWLVWQRSHGETGRKVSIMEAAILDLQNELEPPFSMNRFEDRR